MSTKDRLKKIAKQFIVNDSKEDTPKDENKIIKSVEDKPIESNENIARLVDEDSEEEIPEKSKKNTKETSKKPIRKPVESDESDDDFQLGEKEVFFIKENLKELNKNVKNLKRKMFKDSAKQAIKSGLALSDEENDTKKKKRNAKYDSDSDDEKDLFKSFCR